MLLCCMNVHNVSLCRFLIMLSILDIHLHHKLDVTILQQKEYNFIASSTSIPASSTNHNCSDLSFLGQRSQITTH